MSLLMLLKSNWRVIAVFLAAGAFYGFGYYHGQDAAETRCREEKQAEREALQAQKDAIQKAADAASKDYEDYRAMTDALLDQANEGLENEKKRNSAFASCHSGKEFVRIYEQAAKNKHGR